MYDKKPYLWRAVMYKGKEKNFCRMFSSYFDDDFVQCLITNYSISVIHFSHEDDVRKVRDIFSKYITLFNIDFEYLYSSYGQEMTLRELDNSWWVDDYSHLIDIYANRHRFCLVKK